MANSFCTNCGAPLKPNAKFCGHCGAKLVSSDEQPKTSNTVDSNPTNSQNSNTVNTIKQKASAIVNEDTINNVKQKASTLLNEKNLNDVKEKASTFIHEANVNELKEQATANVQKLPNWLKIVAVVLIVALVGYGGYYYFSPEKQVTRIVDNYMDLTLEVATKQSEDVPNSDLEKFSEFFPPDVEKKIKQNISPIRKPRPVLAEKPSYKILDVTIKDNTAKVYVKIDIDKEDAQLAGLSERSSILLKKINETWYITGFDY